ncbi:leucine aminopeptidase/pepditase M28/metalloprotease [Polychaeton citri CBS 116435]|uniref:Peptide hydrolase n=1 Tax=Polychaeton citri CBS 116435 TaxID=1314669 RepID=A0A9P4QJD3_9PEZI|nr:leucine aminopeptidase/pepditase M28/metalloprotease [Polychaeton citri CBS 116435]
MKSTSILTSIAAVSTVVSGLGIPNLQQVIDTASSLNPLASHDRYLIELDAGDVRWVTEEEKWQLRRQGKRFFDITEDPQAFSAVSDRAPIAYPSRPAYNETLAPLMSELDRKNMERHLEKFTGFHTRYYKSDYGRQSSEWLLDQVNQTLYGAGKDGKSVGSVRHFKHSWGQNSIIATLPGKSEKTIVIGAHQDSINLFLPSILAAPGADDDGSGTVTILEALRVLLKDERIISGKAENTVEFHWYSAEEGGLLGSQAIFSAYEREGRDVKAMLQQDMTGYTHATIEAGEPESVGVITDYVDPGLTTFIKKVVEEYCDIPYIETKCGYACSDHASASKAGYPSAFVIESDFKYSDKKIHTTEDKIEFLDFKHMLQHAKLTLGLVYELAFAKFD